MHTMLDLRGSIPTFIWLSEAAVSDINAMDIMPVESGAIYLIDKGYVDFWRLFNRIDRQGAFFVTRAKDNMKLNGFTDKKKYEFAKEKDLRETIEKQQTHIDELTEKVQSLSILKDYISPKEHFEALEELKDVLGKSIDALIEEHPVSEENWQI